jgi:hypothetical protein
MLKRIRNCAEKIFDLVLFNGNRLGFPAICLITLLLVFVLPASPVFASEKTHPGTRPKATIQRPAQDHGPLSEVEAKWGIKILNLRMTAGGHMLDLRYAVIDPVKAGEILKKKSKAYLTDQKTGKTVTVPITKAGPMKQSTLKPEANRIYFVLFNNSGGLFRDGSEVTVTLGEFKMENVVVEGWGQKPASAQTSMPQMTEAQQKKWIKVQPVQQVLLREFRVCREHCGGNKDCLDRCAKVFGVRLDREYQRLTYE